ncbi:hypothetical protein [Moraxella sp. VT-16-12]|uniref:hypothetical protein n=1 Tax=Moraxella sp. VT-16-12 TaxID=2014877 RepID=UPI000B7DFE40|nr:hypothetical protein [Moraxella sp. VT-16-12]TWV83038.1 hypothetical protein CEW93_005070 [Moraxella sp. VT-16-12]
MNQIILKRVILSCLFGCLGVGVLSAHATTPKQFDNIATNKNITKDKLTERLLGTWQCHFDDTDNTTGISYRSTLHFNKNGTFTSKKISHTKNPDGTYHVNTTRAWSLAQFDDVWILQEKIINIDYFSFDNPAAEQIFDVKQMLNNPETQESLMIFEKKGNQDTLTRLDAIWGMAFGECIKDD